MNDILDIIISSLYYIGLLLREEYLVMTFSHKLMQIVDVVF